MSSRSKQPSVLIMVVALVATAGLVVSACGGANKTTTTAAPTTSTGAAKVKITRIGVMVPEKANDFGWSQQHAAAGRTFAAEIGAEFVLADGVGYEDPAPIMRQLVADGCDWIMATPDGSDKVAVQVSQEKHIYVNVIGEYGSGNLPGRTEDFETKAQEGAYLAGVVAAMMTKTGTIGIVMSADDENWTAMSGGFVTAAKAVNPNINIKVAQVGPLAYTDAPAAKRTTDSVIAAGADIIFGMGDGASFGEMQAVENATPPSGADKVYFIDVIGDKSSLDKKGIYLTSVVWNYVPAWQEAYDMLQNGTFGTKTIYIDLKNGGVDILKTQYIPDAVWQKVEQVKQQIIDGTVKVPFLVKKSELDALVQ